MIVHLIAKCSSLDTSSHSWSPEEVYDEVLRVQQSLEVRQSLLHAEQDWNHLVERWESQPLAAIHVADLQKQINNFLHTLDYLEKGIYVCKEEDRAHSQTLNNQARRQQYHWLPFQHVTVYLFIFSLYEFCTTPGVYTKVKQPPSHAAKIKAA